MTQFRKMVYFTPQQQEFLKAEAAEKGLTMSDLIRRIIDAYRGEK